MQRITDDGLRAFPGRNLDGHLVVISINKLLGAVGRPSPVPSSSDHTLARCQFPRAAQLKMASWLITNLCMVVLCEFGEIGTTVIQAVSHCASFA